MDCENIDDLFSYISSKFTCGDKFYISGILGTGAMFDDILVEVYDNKNLITDLEEPEQIKRIKQLEKINRTKFLSRIKFILSNISDKSIIVDLRNVKKGLLSSDYDKVNVWYNYENNVLNLHVRSVNDDELPVTVAFSDTLEAYIKDFKFDLYVEPLVTKITDINGNIIYQSLEHNKRKEYESYFRVQKLSRLMQEFIDEYRLKNVAEITKEDAVTFAVQIFLASQFITYIETNALREYSIEYSEELSSENIISKKGLITDYIGPDVFSYDNIINSKVINMNGLRYYNLFSNIKDIRKKFEALDDTSIIIELAQEQAFQVMGIDTKIKKLV